MELNDHEIKKISEFAEQIIPKWKFYLDYLAVRYDLIERYKEAKEIKGMNIDGFLDSLSGEEQWTK